MLGRYAVSIIVGSIITVTLLFVMQLLIVTGKQALTKPRERHNLEFVRVRRNENLNVEDFVPEKIDFDLSLPEGPIDPLSPPLLGSLLCRV